MAPTVTQHDNPSTKNKPCVINGIPSTKVYILFETKLKKFNEKKKKNNIKNKLHNKYGKIKHLMICDRSNLPVTFENKMSTFKCVL